MNHTAINQALKDHLAAAGFGVRVVRKRSSVLMKVIAFFLYPFNPRFMSHYTTTFAGRMWVPDGWNEDAGAAWRTLAHEGVHRKQAEQLGEIPFGLAYLFPLPLVLLALGAFGAFWTPWAWLFLMFLLAAAPWPAPWRVRYEREAYLITAMCDGLLGIDISSDWYLDYQVEHHCGWGYYKPAWRRARVRELVRNDILRAKQALNGIGDDYALGVLSVIKAHV